MDALLTLGNSHQIVSLLLPEQQELGTHPSQFGFVQLGSDSSRT